MEVLLIKARWDAKDKFKSHWASICAMSPIVQHTHILWFIMCCPFFVHVSLHEKQKVEGRPHGLLLVI